MPVNAGYEFFEVEKSYLEAENVEDKIYWLEEMIRKAPKHKSSENLLAGLRSRLKKLKEQSEKIRKGKGGKKGIRKEGYQVVLVGKTNSGKSALLGKLTNAKSSVSEHMFSTRYSEIGTMDYEGVRAQIIDTPAIKSEYYDVGLVNNADCLLVVVAGLAELDEVGEWLSRARGERIIVINKLDLLDNNEKRKLGERCKSKRLKNFVLVSSINGEGIEKLKEMIFHKMKVIRVYTKEPGKKAAKDPMVLKEGSRVRDVAEKILKGFSARIKETRLTGPSAKFANQKAGLNHVLKDKDVIEFHMD
ncbi:hypothetical protein AUJ84_01020 [Candidatus Pacearchaeota archaeon CG1_02_32_132]|nr:MAG: hypothetical protein AUJ84_01020 [Candidatus Pacearchaeota archaeon CG1_02_32_132]